MRKDIVRNDPLNAGERARLIQIHTALDEDDD
jgi:hypothetical protein